MKVFDEKHEVIIDCWFKPKVNNAKQGDIIPHQKIVSRIEFYHRQFINDQEVFVKIQLTKEMIRDLSDKIQGIESEVVEMPFDDLPF